MKILATDEQSLARWQRLRPTPKQMLRMGTNKKTFHCVRFGQLEAWGNGFFLLVGNSPDVPMEDMTQRMQRFSDWSDMKDRLLTPGACPVEPLLYLEADRYSVQERRLLVMEMRSPTDSDVIMEHLTVNATMALFIERECRARFPEDWILGWRGNLSAEARIHGCAKVHPKPLTYCVRGPGAGYTAAGVLMPRTWGSQLVSKDGSVALQYDVTRRVCYRDA